MTRDSQERTNTILQESGELKQVLMSFLRSVCRADFEYEPDETLDIYKKMCLDRLEKTRLSGRYRFTAVHADILRATRLPEFKAVVRKKFIVTYGIGGSCPYQRDPRKFSCRACKVSSRAIRHFIGEDDEIGQNSTE
jgi:hypothetical protein